MKNIKLIRVTKDYTQLRVQMETGISQSILSKYENGELMPTSENLIILAKFYNTSVDFLLDLTDNQIPYPQKMSSD
ncbi:MAG: helix-turn-helix transcriptional regulator [Ruminococcaceae bacterium]|nr:helix-turn-helix transcriptional regulator [Oscillospiraceae bacterium]